MEAFERFVEEPYNSRRPRIDLDFARRRVSTASGSERPLPKAPLACMLNLCTRRYKVTFAYPRDAWDKGVGKLFARFAIEPVR